MSRFAQHISVEEYACQHCHALPPSWEGDVIPAAHKSLFAAFEDIRYEWGKPITINSGYRCLTHNQAVGGEDCSIHLFGLALDISAQDQADNDVLHRIILTMHPELRIGRYTRKSNFIHIDVGFLIDPKAFAEWRPGARWNS